MLSRSCYLGKESEYFDKRDVARFLNCYIYNGDFCDNVYGWTLLTAFITKSSVVDLVSYPRYTLFTSNPKTLKRNSCESIAMSAKFL